MLSEVPALALIEARHSDPFSVLGLHKSGKQWIARAFVPGAEHITVQTLEGAPLGKIERRHDAGFFEGPVTATGQHPIRFACSNAGTSSGIRFCAVSNCANIACNKSSRLLDSISARIVSSASADKNS